MLIETFVLLLAGHALADFALQGEAMAKGKNRHNRTTPPPGAKYQPSWQYWLSAHALIHGAVVYFITGLFVLLILEAVYHWLIDFFKCENYYGIHTDQALHAFCKLAWAVAFVWIT